MSVFPRELGVATSSCIVSKTLFESPWLERGTLVPSIPCVEIRTVLSGKSHTMKELHLLLLRDSSGGVSLMEASFKKIARLNLMGW